LLGLLQEPREAHFDELIQIARTDPQELHPLEQRIAAIECFLQYAMIELQPREMAVEE
jgi:hypothetical protein